jgi:hypothetical protein
MSTEDNKALVLLWREELWKKRNVDALTSSRHPIMWAISPGFPARSGVAMHASGCSRPGLLPSTSG